MRILCYVMSEVAFGTKHITSLNHVKHDRQSDELALYRDRLPENYVI